MCVCCVCVCVYVTYLFKNTEIRSSLNVTCKDEHGLQFAQIIGARR